MTLGQMIFLWAGPLLQFRLVMVFLNRSILITKFPGFFVYTCFGVVSGVLHIAFVNNMPVYYWAYWSTQLICDVLTLFVMQEAFSTVWRFKQHLCRHALSGLILAIT